MKKKLTSRRGRGRRVQTHLFKESTAGQVRVLLDVSEQRDGATNKAMRPRQMSEDLSSRERPTQREDVVGEESHSGGVARDKESEREG
jgi:hypothetical protein